MNVILSQQLYQHMKVIHDLGVVHGDFQPRNVVMDPVTESIKVIDFSHSMLHECSGQSCFELAEVERELLG